MFSCKCCDIFKNGYLGEHLPKAASVLNGFFGLWEIWKCFSTLLHQKQNEFYLRIVYQSYKDLLQVFLCIFLQVYQSKISTLSVLLIYVYLLDSLKLSLSFKFAIVSFILVFLLSTILTMISLSSLESIFNVFNILRSGVLGKTTYSTWKGITFSLSTSSYWMLWTSQIFFCVSVFIWTKINRNFF